MYENLLDGFAEEVASFYPDDRSNRQVSAHKHEELIEAALGLAGESGEAIDIIKKTVYYGKDLDREHLEEELGDALHYLVRLIDLSGLTLGEVMINNLQKLDKRFPNGYCNHNAINKGE